MSTFKLPDNVSRALNKGLFQLKKHSPEILVVTGIVGGVVSGVLACKATLKVNNVVDKAKEDIEKIHAATEKGVTEAGEVYDLQDSKKDLAIVYTKTGVELVKLYGPSLAVGALSITSILTGHNILHKRNAALAAAYAVVDSSFKDYRRRLVDRFGKDLDRELKYDIKAQEVEETIVDENGKEKKVKKTVHVVNPNGHSEFAVIYDDGCKGWSKDPEANKCFLLQTQNYLNDKLRHDGYLFLNDALDALGFPKTKAGQIVGWIYDPVNNIDGDNYIDFGLFDDPSNERKAAFVNGFETNVVVDFNVDGNIWELMR